MSLPSYSRRFAHLAALWAYGVAQPVFSMLKGNPEFLVLRGTTRLELVVFAVAIVLLPPLAAVGLQAGVRWLSSSLSDVLHVTAIWAFGTIVAVDILRHVHPARAAWLLVAVALGYAGTIAYLRWSFVRSFLTLSLALPCIGLVLFAATARLAVLDHEPAPVSSTTRTPVVLLVLDELPVSSLMRTNGSIDEIRYPAFARLAREATWYPRATTVHDWTLDAVPAILTGNRAPPGRLPTLGDHPDNLFTLLGRGYDFRVREQMTRLCPSRSCPGRPKRYGGLVADVGVAYLHRSLPSSVPERLGLPRIAEWWHPYVDGTPVSEFESFLRQVTPSPSLRRLYFLHLLLPHGSWQYLPSGRRYANSERLDGTRNAWGLWREDTPWLVDQGLQRHLLQVGFTDRLLGRLLDRLKEIDIYDDALVIVTADHGVSFEPGSPRRGATRANLPDIVGVPLFVKYPRQLRGRVDLRDAQTIDILPTIADAVGLPLPWAVEGRSLLDTPVARRISIGGGDTKVEAPTAAVAAGVRRTARRNASVFGEGHESMYRLGLRSRLLGQCVSSLAVRARLSGAVGVYNGHLFEDIRPRSVLPAHVVGELRSDLLDEVGELAIAVNGRIAALTRPFSEEGRVLFAALVPEDSLREGRNAVDVYAVRPAEADVSLVRLGGTTANPGQCVGRS